MIQELTVYPIEGFKCLFIDDFTENSLETLIDFIGNNCDLILDIAYGDDNFSCSTYASLDEICFHAKEYPFGCYCVIESSDLLPVFLHPEDFHIKYKV